LTLETLFADRRVIHICGPVLIGKSRLAVEYAKWHSATSAEPRSIFYIRLSQARDASSILQAIADSIGRNVDTIRDCAAYLRSSGGIVILDEADNLPSGTSAVLGELLDEVDQECGIIVTSRSSDLTWLRGHSTLRPKTLPLSKRVELTRRWAEET